MSGQRTCRVPVRVAHLEPGEWTSPRSRQTVFAMARKGEIDTVVLDVKDGTGQVPCLSNVVLTGQVGAGSDRYRSPVRRHHSAWVIADVVRRHACGHRFTRWRDANAMYACLA
ncbi:hypothetical protein SK571_14335 [Lentzea sp. BCCO 10_0798]|uniref:Uncharacterized protein n=1 Tax=Lentzea kristufekii TaxID=3095430 RepID=A0ABU4TQS2_9PSEU|nr:hypothetical protein [Lentzea sp. BCCO 10_0798]MDX8050565.1 hypothetical protein [Lentzea sp. BCCO 10_0798]